MLRIGLSLNLLLNCMNLPEFYFSQYFVFNNILMSMQIVKYEDVKQIVKQNLQGNTFCLFPESFLCAVVREEDSTVENLGLQTIVGLRSK